MRQKYAVSQCLIDGSRVKHHLVRYFLRYLSFQPHGTGKNQIHRCLPAGFQHPGHVNARLPFLNHIMAWLQFFIRKIFIENPFQALLINDDAVGNAFQDLSGSCLGIDENVLRMPEIRLSVIRVISQSYCANCNCSGK